MTKRLEGKVAVVTGGAGGIGEATVRLFHEHGARVMIVDIDESMSRQVAVGIDPTGERVSYTIAHLDKELEAKSAIGRTIEVFGRIDILANIASIRVPPSDIPHSSTDDFIRVLGANLLSVSHCSKYAIPHMIEVGGGSIINVSSANATVGRKEWGMYDAAKAGVLALTRAMASDHAHQGIRVNATLPGPTLTKYHVARAVAATGRSALEIEAEMRAKGAPNTLLGRSAEPIEQAYPILWLASDESSYVTAADFNIDGGIIGLRD